MSGSSGSPILAAFAKLSDAEQAHSEQVNTAQTHAEKQRERLRQAHALDISGVKELMEEQASRRTSAEGTFIIRGLSVPAHPNKTANAARHGAAKSEFHDSIERIDSLIKAVNESWRAYDEIRSADRRRRLQRTLITVAITSFVVLVGVLMVLGQRQMEAVAARTAVAMTQSARTAVAMTQSARTAVAMTLDEQFRQMEAAATGTAVAMTQSARTAVAMTQAVIAQATVDAILAQVSAYDVDFLTHNDDWMPIVQEFDGVPMVLVPPGCFLMGSTDGASDEQPVNEQCFDAPFWIDQTEVTQADFERFGGVQARASGFSGENRPVEQITWFEARDFCALRGARLPTEAEWEYAARGPDSLVYPWGDSWNEANAVWYNNSNRQTADVGSRPAGASWVGALDMSGNVWEWTNSLYLPYDSKEDREADTGNSTNVQRVLRGGSWFNLSTGLLRSAYRHWIIPDGRYNYLGFRCARSS